MVPVLSLTKSETLRFFLVSIILGLFFASFIQIEFSILLGGLFCVFAIIWRNIWIFGLSLFFLSLFYAQFRDTFDFRSDFLQTFEDQKVSLTGPVVSFPDIREKNIRIYVEAHSFNTDTKESHSTLGKFLLILPRKNQIDYGDVISVTGKLQRPRNFQDFDYEAYLRRFGAQMIMRNPQKFEIIAPQSGGNILLRWAKKARNFFAINLQNSLPVPHDKIAMGILLGVKNELPHSTQEDFKQSGLQHILVVSGSNVAIVIIFVSFFLKRFGRRIVFLGALVALIFFVSMTGADPPILRAAIMGGTVAWAASIGRRSETRNLVLFSAVLMGLWNPKIIQMDIGFFLSTFATMGILIGVPVLTKWTEKWPDKFSIKTLLIVSLAAQIAVLPILGIYFGTFPVVGIFANLFSEPLVPLGMGFSFLSTILGVLPEPIAKIIGFPAYLILEALLQIARFFGQILPMELSKEISFAALSGVLAFFMYGLFSRKFQQKYLEKYSVEAQISSHLK